MQFGIIGFGAWGRLHAKAMESIASIDLVAISCGSAASVEEARTAHPHAVVYQDWRRLLSDSKIDAVSAESPPHASWYCCVECRQERADGKALGKLLGRL
mgnify:CR=1 FL=1